MQVSVENVGKLERKLTVRFPVEQLESQVRERIVQMGRSARLKGFRPGKVPAKVIEQRYGAQIRGEALSELIGSTFREAVAKENLRPVAPPSIDTTGAPEAGEIAYTATFEVLPELGGVDVAALEIERPVATVTDADIDTMIETLRQQRRGFEVVERAAQAGDLVLFEYAAQTADRRWPEQGLERAGSVLGSGTLFKEFDAALTGQAIGAELEIDVAFPTEFRNPDLAGKLARVTLKVTKVQAPKVPELDAAFIRQFGIADGSLETFRTEVRANLERELTNTLLARLKGEVAGKLAATRPDLDVPRVMVQAEAEAIARAGLPQGAQPPAEALVAAEPLARRRVIASLLMGEIARQNQLRVDGKRVSELLGAIASTYEEPHKVIELYNADPQLMSGLHNRVLEDQVAEWVAEHARTTEKHLSFDEVMRPNQAA